MTFVSDQVTCRILQPILSTGSEQQGQDIRVRPVQGQTSISDPDQNLGFTCIYSSGMQETIFHSALVVLTHSRQFSVEVQRNTVGDTLSRAVHPGITIYKIMCTLKLIFDYMAHLKNVISSCFFFFFLFFCKFCDIILNS